jgi:hypothetical protein
LCHREVTLRPSAGPEYLDQSGFSASARQSPAEVEGLRSPELQQAAARVGKALRSVYPLPVAFERLLEYTAGRDALREILYAMIGRGVAQFHVHHFASSVSVSARPRSSRLARWESARTGVATYSTHTALKLDSIVRELIHLLDGTRTFEDIVGALAQVEDAPTPGEIRARLPKILERLAATGLLEG